VVGHGGVERCRSAQWKREGGGGTSRRQSTVATERRGTPALRHCSTRCVHTQHHGNNTAVHAMHSQRTLSLGHTVTTAYDQPVDGLVGTSGEYPRQPRI